MHILWYWKFKQHQLQFLLHLLVLFVFVFNNIAINIIHEMTSWYCYIPIQLTESHRESEISCTAIISPAMITMILVLQTFIQLQDMALKKKSNQVLKMTSTWHGNILKQSSEMFYAGLIWWMKLMIKVFFKGSAGQHKRHGVSPVRPTTHISWPLGTFKTRRQTWAASVSKSFYFLYFATQIYISFAFNVCLFMMIQFNFSKPSSLL